MDTDAVRAAESGLGGTQGQGNGLWNLGLVARYRNLGLVSLLSKCRSKPLEIVVDIYPSLHLSWLDD